MLRHIALSVVLAVSAWTLPAATATSPHTLGDGDTIQVRGRFAEPLYGNATLQDGTMIFGEAHLDALAVTRDGSPIDAALEVAATTDYEVSAPAVGDCARKPLVRIHDGEVLVVLLDGDNACPTMAAQANDGAFRATIKTVTATGAHITVALDLE